MSDKVRAKKHLGQHFLKDTSIAQKIADSLIPADISFPVLEIGPGMGILTQFLLPRFGSDLKVIEIDRESVDYLRKNYPQLNENLVEGDFLEINLSLLFNSPFSIIGNFPYNISTQILFQVYDNRDKVKQVVGMFQREVARRITSPHGNKDYGILSVLLQAFYSTEYLFTVNEGVFQPPPKVKSGVLRLIRKENFDLGCDARLFKAVVKSAFNQRRKTLRNALHSLCDSHQINSDLLPFKEKRAEQLPWTDFVELTKFIQGKITPSQSSQ